MRLPQKLQENIVLLSWGVILLLAILGFVSLLLGATLLAVALFAFACGGALNTILMQQVLVKPLREITATGQSLILTASTAFSDALVSLSQGNLTTRIEHHSNLLPQPKSNELKPVVDLLNLYLVMLDGSAKEFNTITDEPCRRLFYLGADLYLEGRVCAEILGKVLEGRGEILIVTLDASHSSMALRYKGFEGLLRDKYPGLRVVAMLENGSDPENAAPLVRNFLDKHPNLAGIYVTDGANPPGVAKAVEEAGLSGKLKIVSHDLVDETMHYLATGVITATLGQDPFAQGHDPVIHLFNHLVSGWRPESPRLITSQDVITAENYQDYWKAGVGIIESKATSARRARPIKPAARPLRIAVIGRNESSFWEPVHAGVLAAADELRSYNATVEWLVPDQDQKIDINARIRLIQELVEQGCDAIALDILDQSLVPYINKSVERGVPVGVFNGEPGSLRSLLSMVAVRASNLFTVSKELASAAQKVGGLASLTELNAGFDSDRPALPNRGSIVKNITDAIREVAADAQEQSRSVEKVTLAINQIADAIAEVIQNIGSVSEAAFSSAGTAKDGTQTVQEILIQIQNIQNAVEITADAIRDMSAYSQKIGEINVTIKEFTDQTSLLALNASIVAAGASDGGKGFTVIAHEIRDLAEKSAVATKEVNAIIQAVQKSIQRATESMEVATGRVKEGSILASNSSLALDQLMSSAEEMQQKTLPLVSTGASVRKAIDYLIESNDQVSGVIAENIAATEQISATTQELAAETRQVSSSAAALAGIARELEGAIAVFQVDKKL